MAVFPKGKPAASPVRTSIRSIALITSRIASPLMGQQARHSQCTIYAIAHLGAPPTRDREEIEIAVGRYASRENGEEYAPGGLRSLQAPRH
jgi:hypothetical protein